MSRSIRGASAVLVAAGCLLTFLGLVTHRAVAQPLPAGTAVTVYFPEDGGVPYDYFSRIIFTGQAAASVDLSECSETPLLMQDAVLVDSQGQGQQSSHTVTVFVLRYQSDPVPAGTVVSGFAPAGSCLSDGIHYRKFSAVAE